MFHKLIISLLLVASSALAKPNFVFILIDDMSWTGTSVKMDENVNGSRSDFYQTPNIEKLAKQGLRFSNAYSPGPMCTPSRAGILTGKTPAELHMTSPGGGRAQTYQKLAAPSHVRNLPTQETTIAEALKKQGYATAHIGKWHLGSVDPGKHGFDVHDGATGNESNGTKDNPKDIFGITERGIKFMTEQTKAGKPFYLQLSHYAVHSPIEGLEASQKKFSNVQKGTRHTDASYAAMTWDLDSSIGTLLNKIDELKLADNTYVVLMSDNGGPSNPRQSQNLPLNGGKGSLYEGGIRVPLLIRGPGIKANTLTHENVTGCDLFPTFCDLAKVPQVQVTGKIDGVSLVPLLAGKQNQFKRSETTLLFHYPHYGRGPRQKPQTAIISGNYKLLRDLETGNLQLFNLEKDLVEKSNLSQKNPEKTKQLEKLMDKRLKETKAQIPTNNSNYDPNATQQRGRGRPNSR